MSDIPASDIRFDALEKIAAERDRLYGERHAAMQNKIDTALDGLRDALDKAFASSQSALTNEHSLIMEMMAALKTSTLANQVEVEKLRNIASRSTGREEPINAVIKWIAGLLALAMAGLFAYFHK